MGLETSFCMEKGQVKAGTDELDTFVKMLQEIVRVTEPMAYGIAAAYPTVMSLVRGFREKGPGMLEDLQVCYVRFGSFFSFSLIPFFFSFPSLSHTKIRVQ